MKFNKLCIPSKIIFLLQIYLLGIIILTSFRLILLTVEFDRLSDSSNSLWLVLQALFMGWRFDTVISGYVLAIPALLLVVAEITQKKIIIKIAGLLTAMLYLPVYLIGIADIPYFGYNFSRLNSSAFLWIDSPIFVINMIMQSPLYLFYVLLVLVVCIGYLYSWKKIINRILINDKSEKRSLINLAVFYPLLLFVIFIAIRGRIDEKSPIRTGTAYFSDNPFINQLGLNPTFTLIRSIADDRNPDFSEINLLPPDQALQNTAAELNGRITANHKLVRQENTIGQPKKFNVVVILMESMSAIYLKKGGAKKEFAPFMDSLAEKSIYFDNFFSSGLHTFNGVYSTLYSMPALFRQHPLKSLKTKPVKGLPQTLKENGYRNYLFMTHDDQFDNMGGYLRNNGFDKVYSKSDYPTKFIVSTLGIPDDKLYEQVIEKLKTDSENPFFCTILTVSNHPPYYTPDYFKSKLTNEKERGAAFADWSLGQFFAAAQKEKWYNNTLFVILGDHGTNQPDNYELPISFGHIPLIIHGLGESQVVSKPSGQLDVFPTIMGLLNISYSNYGLGIDLLKNQRGYIYTNGDDKTVAVADSFYYIFKSKNENAVYDLRTGSGENLIDKLKSRADSLKLKIFSQLQTAQGIIK